MDYLQTNSNAEYIISGDLNMNYNRWDLKGLKLLKEFERNYNLNQIINGNTRIIEGSKSLLDLIFMDISFLNESGIWKPG